MKIKNLIWLLLSLFVFACSDDDNEYTTGQYFTLSETNLSFENGAATQSVGFVHPAGTTTAEVLTKNCDWCSVAIVKDSVQVTVTENVLVTSRRAMVEVKSGNNSVMLLVRQAQKYFTSISPISNLTATSGPGEVTLVWTVPTEDNFSHVIIRYEKQGVPCEITVDPGATQYTVKELLASDGEYNFEVQSVDKENELGPICSVSQKANKLVALRFEKNVAPSYLPYFFKSSNAEYTTALRVGSTERNEGEEITIEFGIDPDALAAYNEENGTAYELMPDAAYALPAPVVYLGDNDYQDMTLTFNDLSDIALKNNQGYAIPLTIKSVSSATISEIMNTVILRYEVDDLSGWYTVERLENCGEGAGKYPAGARRYIRRTGDNTWETAYLFSDYVNSENPSGLGKNSYQYITIDPDTKAIFIQQGNYGVAESRNAFDPVTQELHIEYLYSAWAGWWTHERMYNRSLTK